MFAQRLKELREEKKLSQRALAEALQVQKQSISDWENGKSETSFELLAKIAVYFNVSTDFLLGLKEY